LLFFYILCLLIILSIKGYIFSLFYSHIVINSSSLNFFIFVSTVFTILLVILKNITEFNWNTYSEFYYIYILMYLWFIGLFCINNLFSFIFYLELLSLSITSCLICFLKFNDVSYFYNFNLFYENKKNKFFLYSFLYIFWISFLSLIFLFLSFSYVIRLVGTFDLFIIDIVLINSIYGLTSLKLMNLSFLWYTFISSISLKLGLFPFFLWKPNFFKSIPYLYLLIYVSLFYFFIFIYSYILIFNYLYIFILKFYFLNLFFFIITLILLTFVLFNVNYIKVFVAYSSILNSTLMLFVLLNFISI